MRNKYKEIISHFISNFSWFKSGTWEGRIESEECIRFSYL